jgi:hypothetical protein
LYVDADGWTGDLASLDGGDNSTLEDAPNITIVADETVAFTALGAIVAQYDWMPDAFRVVDCESSWNPDAVSWAGARGLMQLMSVHAWRFARRGWDYWVDVFVPERNVAIAYELYQEQGWGIWSCR